MKLTLLNEFIHLSLFPTPVLIGVHFATTMAGKIKA